MKNGQCYDCQYKARKGEIGLNKKAFEDGMRGNTVCLAVCDTCGKETGILPQGDMDRAIRASNGGFIHSAEWD